MEQEETAVTEKTPSVPSVASCSSQTNQFKGFANAHWNAQNRLLQFLSFYAKVDV